LRPKRRRDWQLKLLPRLSKSALKLRKPNVYDLKRKLRLKKKD